ncbi:MAG: hypothetical protein LBV04_05500 [Deferribacteraceae bacterium]|jgi:uncharacterized integral membrane protein|nr:hypothetical protein [Deferribacteraceae bacterium]
MKYIITAIKAILLITIVLFCIANLDAMQLALLPGNIGPVYMIPRFLPVLAGIIGGAVFTGVFMYAERWKIAGELKKAQRQLKTLQDEVQRLHNLPLAEKDQDDAV